MSDSVIQVNSELAVLAHMEAINKLLQGNPQLRDAVAEKLESGNLGRELREVVARRKAALSYYTEEHGEQLRPWLDKFIADGKPLEFKLAHYPNTALRTLYLRIYQGWLWLNDNHPDKQKYIELKASTQIVQRPKVGVRIRRKGAVDMPLHGEEVAEKYDDINKLQNQITEFLEQPLEHDSIFEQKNLSLSDEQINLIKDSLVGITGVTSIVEVNRVKILRKLKV